MHAHFRHRDDTDTCAFLWLHGGMDAFALATRLDLDLHSAGICLACLSFVSIPLGAGNGQEARRELVRIAPDLWAEGLQESLRDALEQARLNGDPDADEGIREIELNGARARIVHAVIERLALEQTEDARRALQRMESVWPAFGFTPWVDEAPQEGADV
jgi:hypothetical protein